MAFINKTLNKKNFFPSKKMGQNFLTNTEVINNICENIPDLSSYDCVIEIGPGFGAITSHLVCVCPHLICIELDKRLHAELKTKFLNKKNIELINDDFLKIDLQKICKPYKRIMIIANIPYSITTPIILKCLSFYKIKTLYIMVQKEVADKWIYSKTSNRNASTNIINYYFDNRVLVNKLLIYWQYPLIYRLSFDMPTQQFANHPLCVDVLVTTMD